MAGQLDASVVRLRDTQGTIVGAGFLVAERQVLTCAHVVARALNLPDDMQELPQAEINLDFPRLAPGLVLSARPVFWLPPSDKGGGDIAVVELTVDLPRGAQPGRLVTADKLWDHNFRAFGFPNGHDNGVWASGKLRDLQASGWLQIEDIKGEGYRVESGFSGTPVWDEQMDGVVGIVATIEKRSEIRAAFVIPTPLLVQAWSSLRDQTIPPCPYRGLLHFRQEDEPNFFGRETFSAQLVEAVQRQGLTAVIGPSGSGKSSVVFAGLVPELARQGSWLIAPFRPGGHPFRALASALIPLLEPQLSEIDRLDETSKLTQVLQHDSLALEDTIKRVLEKHSDSDHLALIVDQFEELYTLCRDDGERQCFLDLLLAVTQPRSGLGTSHTNLVITLRADFVNHTLSYRPLADALQHADLKLGPMTRQELRDAIEKPAHRLGVKIEDGLTERILDAVRGEPGNLPLLEFTLTLLWSRQNGSKLTHTAYRDIGGVEKALANYAENVYNQLNDVEKRRTQRVFIQLVRLGDGTEDTRRLATRAEVGDDNWDLIAYLASSRLVVTGRNEVTVETVEVVHEALIQAWDRLCDWVEGDREFRMWQDRLRDDIRQWDISSQDDGALLRGVPLGKAKEWLEKREAEISLAERTFIEKSLAVWEQEQIARERARVTRQRLRYMVVALALVVGIAVGSAWLAVNRENISEAQRLASLAEGQMRDAPETAVLLAYEAVERDRNIESEQALRDSLEWLTWKALPLGGHTDFVTSAVFSPDGQRICTASKDSTRLWDLRGNLIAQFKGASLVVFSPNSQYILIALGNTAQMLDINGKQLAIFMGHQQPIRSIQYNSDGQYVLTASDDSTARLWKSDGTPLVVFKGHTGSVTSAVFSRDEQRILTASTDNTARLWNRDGDSLVVLKGHYKPVDSAVFAPDGQSILTASLDGTARLWSYDGKILATLKGHGIAEYVWSAMFSPDGGYIVTASTDNTARLWDRNGALFTTLKGHNDEVRSAVFSLDGQRILTASRDGTARLWSIDGQLLATLRHQGSEMSNAVFSRDGQRILTQSKDKAAYLWEYQGPPLPIKTNHTDRLWSAVFSPDGQQVLTASYDHTARLSVPDQKDVIFGGHTSAVLGVVFSEDGQHILTASQDGTARLWNLQGKLLRTFNVSNYNDPLWVSTAVFARDQQSVLTASMDGIARLWKLDSTLIMSFVGHTEGLSSAVVSPNGQHVLTASLDGTARLWKLDGTEVVRFPHPGGLNKAVFSPDGRYVLTAGNDTTARLWDVSGKELRVFAGHTAKLLDAEFSPDGERVLTASEDGTARMWSREGRQLSIFAGHTDFVASAVFSRDGRRVLTASGDGTARQYLVDVDDLLAVAVCRLERGLTEEEKNRFSVRATGFDLGRRQCPPALSWQKAYPRTTGLIQSTVETQAQTATVQAIEAAATLMSAARQYGPERGALPHRTDNTVAARRAGVSLADFVAEARFFNPYPSRQGWDYGFMFRHTDSNKQYRLVIASTKTWTLYLHEGSVNGIVVGSGKIPNLNLVEGESNYVRLIVSGKTASFSVNDIYVDNNLNVSSKLDAGDVIVATGFVDTNTLPNAITRYEGFTIRSASSTGKTTATTPTPRPAQSGTTPTIQVAATSTARASATSTP